MKGEIILKASYFLTVIILASYASLGFMTNCKTPEVQQEPEPVLEFEFDEDPSIKEPPVILEPKPVKKPVQSDKRIIRYIWRLTYRFSKNRYTTCYTGYDPLDPGHGKYANQRFADRLHLHERRIRYEHNTVALCPEDKQYHLELIQMPDGKWTHKWRIHIDGIHRKEIGESTISGYFAVPRDRMKQSGRIDYLITQAGKYKDMEQRVKNWKSINRKVEYWEWVRYAVYSDGTKKEVE
jgi:hypothetical protein